MKYYLAAKTSALVLCLFLNQQGSDPQLHAFKLTVQERQNQQQSFISEQVREIASRAPEMGNLQRKLEKLEQLRPRLAYDINRIDEVLQPLPYTCDVPEPAPVRVKVVAPAPAPAPIVIEAPAAKSSATAGPIFAGPSEPGTIPDLARKALDSIKGAGGSQELESSIQDVAKKALRTLGDGSYSTVGGSGAQASLQTSSNVGKAKSSGESVSSLARSALDSLGGGGGRQKSQGLGDAEPSYQGDDVARLARHAINSLDGGPGEGSSSSSFGRKDDMASLAKEALRSLDGGSDSRGGASESDQVSDLARGALRNLEGGSGAAPPRFASPDNGSADSDTAQLAARAAQKLQSSNQIVAPAPAEPEAQNDNAEGAAEPAPKKKHHKSHAEKDADKVINADEEGKEGADSGSGDGRSAIDEAKKQLKKLHKANKETYGFITTGVQSTVGSGLRSHAHEGVQNDSPMLSDEPRKTKTVQEITENALKQTENSEPPGLIAKQSLRAEVENESYLRDWQEGQNVGVNIKKPLWEEDEKENEQKVDDAISKVGDRNRKLEITDAVEAKMMEKGQAVEELTLDKLKAYTDRMQAETDHQIAKIESKEALARENKQAVKVKKSHMEREYNRAASKILRARRDDDKEKETMDEINDKSAIKEADKKEKKADKKLEKIEKKEQKKKLNKQVKKEEKEKQEKIEEDEQKLKQEGQEDDDAEKSTVEKEIESAVTKAETDGKIPTEQALKKAEDAVKVAAAETENINQKNSDPDSESTQQIQSLLTQPKDESELVIRI